MRGFQTMRAAAALIFVAGSYQAMAAPSTPPSPSGRTDDPTRGIDFAVDIAEDEAKAQANLGGYFVASDTSTDATTTRNDVAWKLGISVPISGEDDILERATLDKLGDGTKISGQISLLSWRANYDNLNSPAFRRLMDAAVAECERKASETNDAEERARCEAARRMPAESFVLEHTPWARLAMNRSLYSGFWNVGIKGSVAFDRFTYVTPVTLDKVKDNETGYSATAWVTYYPADAVSAWKLEAEYSDASEAADEEIVCKSVVVTPNEDCVKAASGAPTRDDALVIRGEYRRYFPFRSGKGGIGAALTGSVDATEGDWGVELPVYFTIPGQDLTAPGLKFGYASEEDEFSVVFFLKSAFSF